MSPARGPQQAVNLVDDTKNLTVNLKSFLKIIRKTPYFLVKHKQFARDCDAARASKIRSSASQV